MMNLVTKSTLWSLALCNLASADLFPRQQTTQAATQTASSPPKAVTAITSCHAHGSDLFCMAGSDEYQVKTTITATTDIPAQYTDCHSHGSDMFCVDGAGKDVAVQAPAAATSEDHHHETEEENNEQGHDHSHDEGSAASSDGNRHCHFHAGVEHCTSEQATCDNPNRDYNIGLRVGLLFVILATSALGVFGPILLHRVLPTQLNLVFIVLKQFGTGIIISTAFIHLYTHAALMFGNKCLGGLKYESTTSAILMAGLFISFLVEYIGQRVVMSKTRTAAHLSPEERAKVFLSSEVVSILVMEVGIIFHSLLIGLTLVVAGDEFFTTLFVVILFHQMFEGLALGTRIATIGTASDTVHVHAQAQAATPQRAPSPTTSNSTTDKAVPAQETPLEHSAVIPPAGLSMKKKLGLAALFSFITPIGMAIGIGVLQHFNGNDKSTIIAIGTLDALSAGILVWVGLVEMWAADWMVGSHGHPAELAEANILTVFLASAGLISGMILMSVLGKWA